ncbi:MAG: 30S ribosomal protein S17 [Candidatus Levybacteria bacterium RIFCSPLOWO2_02_FULL_37_10]|nr:MAG: 30S ribosomal protein S17 [Candidatus Levybacteria bacterium RIFCSPHIGHO2_01_FULL_37_33]OGH17501.1 MAG: 30S ribosomal protein S17 [Candidatus Levybacteria bacterium RIFCSPHIGHO2_02_FULL_37_11]OGH29413.1 MAG: 30S ribosomal protein S17 [Candidatus Levybacteria bacterium RIFCSPHIGHO2_12_FULL_37_12]OGH32921.1 MAG: 30S ribosomal protein S17 [Candidatus Levybacteria bacterium RIFCSPLOWO2_01_FULL_36_54]OGH43302.1 MAG: 30S ribosomal protein S17 [Candidatus Levybacteria bacterium RIFCSPLOWO2_02_
MQKTLEGKVVSAKMQNTAVVEVFRRKPHPLYKKLLKRSKRYKVETGGLSVSVGDKVKIIETRPTSKGKYFKIMEVVK